MSALRTLVAILAFCAVSLAGCGGDPGHVRASGIIEMDEIDVASMLGGRVAQLRVSEGDTVRAGDTLAVLERGEISAEARAQQAEATRAAAQAREVRVGPRFAEIQAARAELAAARAPLELAERELARVQKLAESHLIAQAELDRARAVRDQAAARVKSAREKLRLLEQGSRREEIAAATAAVEAAHASALAARSRLGELMLTAPVSGVVLLKSFDRGELAQPAQPIVTLGNPDSLWIRVYVPAPRIGRMRLGARVNVYATGFGKRAFTGRVIEIATRAEFTPRAALTEEERANLVFRVKVAIDPTGGVLKAGLPADVEIEAPREPRHG